ncbi:hypothetical protein [Acidithiobacillus thiooxidans]|uniref:Uncharacterized protein n=1 Tax=Acidithiobacillus thiooxidans TaxID=930 RepID=A0A1C2IG97_ACITH|nr:hypothetical protein [Acidithiobacillus thiooxidans]OCX74989.1 hypothetical protein A6M23_03890 [Acidithiobacillus thiooxidans]OCX87016.1 hypothetical protein A6P08_04145 [Acidithiobacillus thiooxidans]
MARRETNLKAPQFGVGGHLHLKADSGKETPAERNPAEQKESAKDVRYPGTISVSGTPSFWYPRDLDLPEKTAPAKLRRVPSEPSRKIPVTIRKKRNYAE